MSETNTEGCKIAVWCLW